VSVGFSSERREFVEIIESVAYAVCGDSDVSFEYFCKIFKTKNVLNKLFQLIDQDLDGVVTAEQVMDFISQLSGAR
jgi:Ca2+-binding EF-hand superfamily protein